MSDDIAPSDDSQADRTTILAALESAALELSETLQRWNRTLVCHAAPRADDMAEDSHLRTGFGHWYSASVDDELAGQPAMAQLADAHAQLHSLARRLLTRSAQGERIHAEDYDLFSHRAQSLHGQIRRLERAFRTALTHLDPLTGAYNRQAMLGELIRERARALRSGRPAMIALADLDHFKRINDTHGHQAGDQVLALVAARLQQNVRPFDKVFRYGGEEFLILLPDADSQEAATVLERLRRALETEALSLQDGSQLTVSASFGAAPIRRGIDISAVVEKADRALYAAKQAGRNRVRVWRAPKGKSSASA